MKVYDGASWITATSAGATSLLRFRYVATSGQTTFSGADSASATLTYTVNNITVCRNGVTLDTSEYTASNGTSVVLTVAAGTGDIVDITAFKSFTVADTYTKGEVDGFSVKLTGAQTIAGVKTFSSDASINGITAGKGGSAVGSNTAFGVNALASNTSGDGNASFGSNALGANTTGGGDCAFGQSALLSNTTGGANTAFGNATLPFSTTASYNTALGYRAGFAMTSGTTNTFSGNKAGGGITTGNNNVCIGGEAGNNTTPITTGSQNIHVGVATNPSAGGVDYEHVIGFNLTGKGANTVYIGNGPCYQGNNGATWSVTSDQRLKKNIVDNTVGLSAITQIRVRNFEYRLPEEVTELAEHCAIKKEGVQLGVIAQEIQTVLPECVKQESTGVMSVDADNLTWYMVNAIKEQQALITSLTARITALENT
jgi:hypothetical protein